MASSVLVLVGNADKVLPGVVEKARALKLGDGLDETTEMGPVISAAHKQRIEEYIELGIEEGVQVILDGRKASVQGLEDGFFIGPVLLDGVTPDMRVAQEEIFGPVLSVMRAENLSEAIAMANTSPFGNGASIFTESGAEAHEFRSNIQAGMVGINVGVPAPMAFLSFGGRKNSFFGDLRVYGQDAVEFYTQKKVVTERWFGGAKTGSIWSS